MREWSASQRNNQYVAVLGLNINPGKYEGYEATSAAVFIGNICCLTHLGENNNLHSAYIIEAVSGRLT